MKVRLKGSPASDCSQFLSASGPPDSKARAAWAYSWPRCTHGRSVRWLVAFTATVTVPTRISVRAIQKARKIRQYSECMSALGRCRRHRTRRRERQRVARATYALHVDAIGEPHELAAQVGDVSVEAAVGGQQPSSECLGHELIACHGAGIRTHQQLEDAQLCRGELKVVASHVGAARAQIDAQRAPENDAGGARTLAGHAAQHRANAR